MAADDPLTAALDEIRDRAGKAAAIAVSWKSQLGQARASADDVHLLLAALDAVLAEHTQHVTSNFPAPGICTHDHRRWPCPTLQAITRAFTGESK